MPAPRPPGRLADLVLRPVDRFWRRAEDPGRGLDFGSQEAWRTSRTLTRCYYAGLLLIAFQQLAIWDYHAGLRAIQPLWPVFWASAVSGRDALIALLLFVAGAFVAALFPDRVVARAAAFAGCLMFGAFVSSFGAVRHVHHLLALTTLLFVLLPAPGGRDDADGEARRAWLRGFWGAQCGALLTYSMSGFVKIATGVWHLATGKGGVLTPDAFALHVANSAIRFGVDAPLAGLAIEARSLGLPLYLAVMYLELFSFPIAFRPRLHRPWGAALLLMHLAIGLTLNLFFVPTVFVLGVLLIASPFAPAGAGWRGALRDLPLFGRLVRAAPRAR